MEFRQAVDVWARAHRAAHAAELEALGSAQHPASPAERQRAVALRKQASEHLRAMLDASERAAAACKPAAPGGAPPAWHDEGSD